MAFTNAELVRQEAGDAGVFVRDLFSGTGSQTTFYLTATPIIGGSNAVTVGGTGKSEGTDYTLDDSTGTLVFGAAPANGTENIVVGYRSSQITDTAIEEACRQHGLTASATADTGPSAAVLNAASMVCNWKASEFANDFDFDADGQSFKRGSLGEMWAKRAEALRVRASRAAGLVSISVTRVDGYSSRGEYAGRDYSGTDENPRRAYYGEEDRIP